MVAPILGGAARGVLQRYLTRKVVMEAGRRAATLLKTTTVIVAGRKVIVTLKSEIFADADGNHNTNGNGVLVAGLYGGDDGHEYIYDCINEDWRPVTGAA